MSWETDFTTTISFTRSTYDTLYKVEEDIAECRKGMSAIKERINGLAFMTEPAKFFPNSEDVRYDIQQEVLELLNEYENLSVELWQLTMLKEEWDECHVTIDGRDFGIRAPKNVENEYHLPRPFIDGDFIPVVDIDGKVTPETMEDFKLDENGHDITRN